jgi:hypothetical protein
VYVGFALTHIGYINVKTHITNICDKALIDNLATNIWDLIFLFMYFVN